MTKIFYDTIYLTDTNKFIESYQAGINFGRENEFSLTIADPDYYQGDKARRDLAFNLIRLTEGQVFIFGDPDYPYPKPTEKVYWIKERSTKNNTKKYYRVVEEISIYGENVFPKNLHWQQKANAWFDLVDFKDLHPHRKPPSLIRRILRNHTEEGDLIFIPFSGSGVVEKVCQEMNRSFISCEIDPAAYCFTWANNNGVRWIEPKKENKNGI